MKLINKKQRRGLTLLEKVFVLIFSVIFFTSILNIFFINNNENNNNNNNLRNIKLNERSNNLNQMNNNYNNIKKEEIKNVEEKKNEERMNNNNIINHNINDKNNKYKNILKKLNDIKLLSYNEKENIKSEILNKVQNIPHEHPFNQYSFEEIINELINFFQLRIKADNKVEYFFHLHKCGGTAMCSYATRNNEKMNGEQKGHNCNLLQDGLWTLSKERKKDGRFNNCYERVEYLDNNEITFNAFERWHDADMCTDDLVYITSIRDPLSRLWSNTRAHDHKVEQVQAWLGANNRNFYRYADGLAGGSAVVDNWFVRSFNGRDVYLLDEGEINSNHLEKAKSILKQYDIIVTLENFGVESIQLEMLLDWDIPSSAKKTKTGHHELPFPEPWIERFKEQNKYDYELYEYAKELALKKVNTCKIAKVVLDSEYFN